MRILFVTLEFRSGAFSGNGVYAQSQARALAKAGHRVHVVAGIPWKALEEKREKGVDARYDDPPNLTITEVVVPDESWGRLDADCGWKTFAEQIGERVDLHRSIVDFDPDAILGVDWSSLAAARKLSKHVNDLRERSKQPRGLVRKKSPPSSTSDTVDEMVTKRESLIAPFVYSNFRVFTRSDREAHLELEADAVSVSRGVLVLCRDDADFVTEHLSPPGVAVAPRVVHPPLREDLRVLADQPENAGKREPPERKYFTCCVRLSPEKEPGRFIALLEWLNRQEEFKASGIVPVLCASTQGSHADAIRRKFKDAAPNGVVMREFLDARGLQNLFEKTVLNFHPCEKDAYGMTIVEAGAFGAPSIANRGGSVGATSILRERDGALIGIDFRRAAGAKEESEEQYAAVLKCLLDRPGTERVGAAAKKAALAWDEEANAAAVAEALHDALDEHSETTIGDRRWRLPKPEDVERLQAVWRDSTIAVWVGGEWVTMQRAEACGATPSMGNSPEWRLGSGGIRGTKRQKTGAGEDSAPMLRTMTRMVILTAHNPMGASRDAATNDLAMKQLALEVRALVEDRTFQDVRPCVSVDAVDGADAWSEPGFAITLDSSSNDAFVAATRLARDHGQAAVYELTGASNGMWKLSVISCFPGLSGLTVENVPLVVREPPKSMPTDPSEARCHWEGDHDAVIGL